jgi:CPA2 family monovalent cation:H+ antiporter-2
VERASLVVITIDHAAKALQTVGNLRKVCPQVPVIARARDLKASSQLIEAGATHAYPEAIEASLRLGATALEILQVPSGDIDQLVQGVRAWDYKPVLEEKVKK